MEHDAAMHLDEWIVEQMAEAVVYSDRDGFIERWNRGAVAMPDALMIPEHLRAAHWRGFRPDGQRHDAPRRAADADTRPAQIRRQVVCRDGFSLVRDDAGTVIGSVAVARDVTERVEREKAARGAKP